MFPTRSPWRRRCGTILSIVLLAGTGGFVFAQEDESGASAGRWWDAAIGERVPVDLDDAGQPPVSRGPAGVDGVDVRDTAVERETDELPLALSVQLAALDKAARANAQIELELGSAASSAASDAAAQIAALWNYGDYDAALAALRELEDAGVTPALGIAWRVPLQLGGQRAMDIRIGGTRTEAQTLCLDFDAQTGHLFSVIRWGSTTASSMWTVNMSTDGGVTWVETYAYSSAVGLIDVDGAVVDNYVYVAYVAGNATDEARLRRCGVSTGAIDGGYAFQTIFDAGTNVIEEVALATNADDFDNRIFYAAIQSNDVLRYAYDVASDGTTFSEYSPAGASPEFGLDMTWNHDHDACDAFVYLSYSGSDGHMHVLGRAEAEWLSWIVETGTGSFRTTAITAYDQTILCAFEYPYSFGTGIRYRISYDCGASWSHGALAVPDGQTIFGYFEPDVDARNGNGTAIVYQAEAGEFDPLYYRTRAGFAPGAWSDPTLLNDHDLYTGSDTAIGYLPPLAAETFSHGALYLSLDPDMRTPYFDRPTSADGACGDNTPPTVSISLPATLDCACEFVAIEGAVADTDGGYVGDRLEIRRRGTTSWTQVDAAFGARTGVLYTWDTAGLAQDFYYVRVVGENECGLSASDVAFVYKPTAFDTLEVRAPMDGGVCGGRVCIDGTAATQSCLASYTVSYRPVAGTFWIPVDPFHPSYTTTVLNDTLAYWDTTALGLADGDYAVQVIGNTQCNNTASTMIAVTVDNTPPLVRLDTPVGCQAFSAGSSVAIYGEVSDENLDVWTLAVLGGPYADWYPLAGPNASNVDGLLCTWDTAGLPACAYLIRLQADDTAVLGCDAGRQTAAAYAAVVVGDVAIADLDRDGDVDWSDANLLLECLNGPNVTTPPAGCDPVDFAHADLDDDCDVDLDDLALFQSLFGG